MEKDLQDAEEQANEKILAKDHRKRESNERLQNSMLVYQDEMFDRYNYLKAFCAMRNLLYREPRDPIHGYSLDSFNLEFAYESLSSPLVYLPFKLCLYTYPKFVRLFQDHNRHLYNHLTNTKEDQYEDDSFQREKEDSSNASEDVD